MRRLLLFYIFFIVFDCAFLNAQQILQFDSLYVNERGDTGRAQFEYRLHSGEKVKHGKFLFTRFISDSTNNNNVYKEVWKGNFDHGEKSSNWNYSKRKFRFSVNEISEKGINYDILEIREELSVNYLKGSPDGDLTYTLNEYKNNKRAEEMEILNLNLQDNKVSGEILYRFKENKDQFSIRGKSENGLLSGIWVFENVLAGDKEIRMYDEGILLSLIRINKEDTLVQIDFPLSDEIENYLLDNDNSFKMAGVPLSFAFSDGYPRNSNFIIEQQSGNRILKRIENIVFLYDSTLERKYGLIFGANRGLYPLSHEEKKVLEAWFEVLNSYKEKVGIVHDSLDAYSIYSADTLLELVNDWRLNQSKLLEYIEPWNSIIENDQLKFYYRKGAIFTYVKRLMENDTLRSEGVHQVLHYSDTNQLDFLAYIVENLRNRTVTGDSMLLILSRRTKELLQSSETSFISEAILANRDTLKEWFDTLTDYKITTSLLMHLKLNYVDSITRKHKNFMNNHDPAKQQIIGRELLEQIRLVKSIFLESTEIERKGSLLDSLYTETNFDPFTYEETQMRSKRRLYGIVLEDMVSSLLQVDSEYRMELSKINRNLQLISKLQDRMIYLRYKDTKRIERSLKANITLDERLEILKVK